MFGGGADVETFTGGTEALYAVVGTDNEPVQYQRRPKGKASPNPDGI